MRERVEQLVGAPRAGDVGDDLPLGLRADAALRRRAAGYTRGFTIYDEADSVRLVKRCIEELDVDPKRFPPRGDQAPDLRREEPAARRRGLPAEGRLLLRADRRRRLRALRAADPRDERDGLRRPAVPLREPVRALPRGAATATGAPSARAGRRVPGHQPRAVPLAAAAGRGAPQPGGGRRRRSVDLRLPRRRHPQHPRLRGRLPRRRGRQARAELPLDADDPRRRQRGDRQQPRAEAASTSGPTPARASRSTSASSRTSTPRRASWPARSSGTWTAAARATRSRSSTATNAQSRVLEDTLVRYGVGYQVIGGTRFYERAEIKDALAYLTLLVNPHDVVAFQRDRQLAAARHRRHLAGAGSSATRTRSASRSSTSRSTPEDIPGLGAAAIKAVGRFMYDDGAAARRAPTASLGRRPARARRSPRPATSTRCEAERTIEAEGRLENLEELVSVAREYDASAEEPSVEEFLQQVALFSEQDDLARRRGHRHADDAPQRQGPRVRRSSS